MALWDSAPGAHPPRPASRLLLPSHEEPELPCSNDFISSQQHFLLQIQRWARFIIHSLFFFWWCWQSDATSTNLHIYFPETKVKFSSLKKHELQLLPCCSLQPRLSALVRQSQAKSWQFSGPDWLLVINIKHLFTPSFQPQYAIKEIIKFHFFCFAGFVFWCGFVCEWGGVVYF